MYKCNNLYKNYNIIRDNFDKVRVLEVGDKLMLELFNTGKDLLAEASMLIRLRNNGAFKTQTLVSW